MSRQRYAIVFGVLCATILGYFVIIKPVLSMGEDGIPFFIKPSAQLQLLNNNSTAQDDPRLIQIIRNDWIAPPSNESSYNLNYPMQVDFSMGQSEVVDQILRQQVISNFKETDQNFILIIPFHQIRSVTRAV